MLWVADTLLAPEPGVSAALADYFNYRIWSAPFSLINYALLGWFYGRAAATTGMMLQMLLHGIDIVFSVWFVHGLGWGVPGAALGTVLGQAVAALVGLSLLMRHYGGSGRGIARHRAGRIARCPCAAAHVRAQPRPDDPLDGADGRLCLVRRARLAHGRSGAFGQCHPAQPADGGRAISSTALPRRPSN